MKVDPLAGLSLPIALRHLKLSDQNISLRSLLLQVFPVALQNAIR